LEKISASDITSCTIIKSRQSLDILVPRLSLGTRLGRLCLPIVENGARYHQTLTGYKNYIISNFIEKLLSFYWRDR